VPLRQAVYAPNCNLNPAIDNTSRFMSADSSPWRFLAEVLSQHLQARSRRDSTKTRNGRKRGERSGR
jgi:hypothetical protein